MGIPLPVRKAARINRLPQLVHAYNPVMLAKDSRTTRNTHAPMCNRTSALQGFGKGYWGNKWRFKIFDGFYTHPKDPETGTLVDVTKRFYHLIERLDAAIKGEDPWLTKQFETDEEMKKEIASKDVVTEVWCSGVCLLGGHLRILTIPQSVFFARQQHRHARSHQLCTLLPHAVLSSMG